MTDEVGRIEFLVPREPLFVRPPLPNMHALLFRLSTFHFIFSSFSPCSKLLLVTECEDVWLTDYVRLATLHETVN